MGKNKRSAQEERIREIRRERLATERKAEKTKKARRNIIIAVSAALAIAIVITGIVIAVGKYKQTNEYKTSVTLFSTQNYTIDLAMFSYYFFDGYYGITDMYGEQLKKNNTYPDITKSLKDQFYGNYTWHEFFSESARNQITMNLVIAEAAKTEGMTLSDEEISALKTRAERIDPAKYGPGVTTEDILKCLELDYMAIKYEYKKRHEFRKEGTELEEYYNEYYKSFSTVDYRCLEVPYNNTSTTSPISVEDAEKCANAVAAATTSEEFTQAIRDNVLFINPVLTPDQIEQVIEASFVEKYEYSEGDIVTEWLFSEDRKPNETYVYHNEATQSFTAYMITQSPVKDMYDTATFRHILFRPDTYGSDEAALAKAQEVLALWEKGGKTEESFANLAVAYSEDASTCYCGGIFENRTEEELQEYLPEMKDWCFADTVKPGDYEIIKTSFGYNLMYYIEDGLPSALGRTQSQTTSEDFGTMYQELQKNYPITTNENELLNFDSSLKA